MHLDLPHAVVDTSEVSGDEYQRKLTVTITGLITATGENEIRVAYE
ncbi:hypothetical protein DFAR_2500030 [Desulfarculales bacterium]